MILSSGWFLVAMLYMLPVIALIRFPAERGALLRMVLKTALYGWCAVAVLMAVGSQFEKHPSFTWRDSLLGASMFAIFVSPLAGLIIWGVNGMTRAGFLVGRGTSVTYNPDLDRTKVTREELIDRDLRDGA